MKKTDKKVIVGIAGATVIAATGALCLFGAQNVHHDTYAIVTDDAGRLSKIENISDGPVNSHVEDPDNRPTGTNVPDGPTVSNP